MPDETEARLACVERQIAQLRRQMVFMDHWHNTMHSRWWMRLWWWLLGFRLLSLGRWYKAPWNASAAKYEG